METSRRSKRKASSEDGDEDTSKRTKISSNTEEAPGFRLLNLPAELRNLVYEKVAEDQTALIHTKSIRYPVNPFLSDDSGILNINDQLAREYLPILVRSAASIQATVLNFDFRHIVSFLNRLSQNELNAMPDTTKPGARSITISLRVSEGPNFRDNDLLKRWLNRAGHATKAGTTLDTIYRVNKEKGFGWYSRDRMIEDYIDKAPNQHAKDEARKVRDALNAR